MEKKDLRDRAREKIVEIEKYLEFFVSIIPANLEEYEKDLKTKAARERYAQKLIDALIDLAFFIINIRRLPSPAEEDSVFITLNKGGVISKELANRLSEAKGMRNVLVHRYGEIDDSKVFYSISEELKRDIN